jgi:hypothetical protein
VSRRSLETGRAQAPHCAENFSTAPGTRTVTPTKIPSGGPSKRFQGYFVAQTF